MRNKNDMVLILFKDHTWFACYPEQVEAFLELNEGERYVIVENWDVDKFFTLLS